MKFKKLTFLLCVSALLGLSACGEQQTNNSTNAVGLMSESSVSAENAKEEPAKKSRSKKKFADNQAAPAVVVNINTATAEELVAALKGTGVGEAKVQSIIAYRKQHGGFKSVDELTEVKGIGQKTVEKLRNRVTVSGETGAAVTQNASGVQN
ncbi:ComEA family DNA-binding protein [Wielerella bovis]|uniref:ComEA family DNA-binding protein n=1 Tax=Wielerella bovis TaxID=2917790 RepID=UPI0020189DCB|nr:helix-hairpin-helix domain-containing protein [Wielerella bovis]ULJ62467.1 helix-hairpin-helix domain-containing protein [Wielerella bovis]ULJ64691.1 helix-hairpin-helix domain-containing protein [Wielerella bovis]ULJ66963.1 helix-hairpin-helix domain-containing protein [Wielerella bovis]